MIHVSIALVPASDPKQPATLNDLRIANVGGTQERGKYVVEAGGEVPAGWVYRAEFDHDRRDHVLVLIGKAIEAMKGGRG